MRTFNPTAEHPARAIQAWQILIGKAMNRQTVTYELLSELMYGKQAAGVLAAILGHIAFYCIDKSNAATYGPRGWEDPRQTGRSYSC